MSSIAPSSARANPSQEPLVAVLIPTLNAEGDLDRLLPALAAQTLRDRTELLAVDSSSDDGTVKRLLEAGFRVESIPRSEFGHGRTRNLLASLSTAEYLVFLSQDATPRDADFLEAIIRPLRTAPEGQPEGTPPLAGVMARMLPNPGDDLLTARTAMASPEASSTPRERHSRDLETAATPRERAQTLRFNNVASCVRRTTMGEIPFPEVPFGEDFAWAARAMGAGFGIRFEPRATVFHAHRYAPSEARRRYRVDAEFHREFHGVAIRPSLFSVLKGVAFEVKEDLRFLFSRGPRSRGFWSALFRSPVLRVAQVLGQYEGSRGAAPGSGWEEARRRGALETT